ncbi:MAG TPA: hypothetical protein VF930_13870 [Stellaceae bacterium]
MSPPRRSVLERRGGDRPNYFFLAFFLRAFFFFGAFFAAPFEAAALARFRLAFICSNPLCRRNAFDSMKVATESRMELQSSGVELRFFVTEGSENRVESHVRGVFAAHFPANRAQSRLRATPPTYRSASQMHAAPRDARFAKTDLLGSPERSLRARAAMQASRVTTARRHPRRMESCANALSPL